jgi:hypothetical protein
VAVPSFQTSEDISPEPKRKARAFGPGWMLVMGGLIGGAATFLLSGDWVCTALGSGVLGAVIVAILDMLARLVSRRWLHRRWGRVQQLALLGIVAAGLTVGSSLSPSNEALFHQALAVSPPEGVLDLHTGRHYAGGPGDMIVLLRFRCDQQTLEKIVAGRPLTLGEELHDQDSALTWKMLWGKMKIAESYDRAWCDVPPMAEPKMYTWSDEASGPIQTVSLLWDAKSGHAYVVYTVG